MDQEAPKATSFSQIKAKMNKEAHERKEQEAKKIKDRATQIFATQASQSTIIRYSDHPKPSNIGSPARTVPAKPRFSEHLLISPTYNPFGSIRDQRIGGQKPISRMYDNAVQEISGPPSIFVLKKLPSRDTQYSRSSSPVPSLLSKNSSRSLDGKFAPKLHASNFDGNLMKTQVQLTRHQERRVELERLSRRSSIPLDKVVVDSNQNVYRKVDRKPAPASVIKPRDSNLGVSNLYGVPTLGQKQRHSLDNSGQKTGEQIRFDRRKEECIKLIQAQGDMGLAGSNLMNNEAISELVKLEQGHNKFVKCKVQGWFNIFGLFATQLMVISVDKKFENTSITSQRIIGLFRHGSNVESVMKNMHNGTLEVMKPILYVCPSGTSYLLIKYFKMI